MIFKHYKQTALFMGKICHPFASISVQLKLLRLTPDDFILFKSDLKQLLTHQRQSELKSLKETAQDSFSETAAISAPRRLASLSSDMQHTRLFSFR